MSLELEQQKRITFALFAKATQCFSCKDSCLHVNYVCRVWSVEPQQQHALQFKKILLLI